MRTVWHASTTSCSCPALRNLAPPGAWVGAPTGAEGAAGAAGAAAGAQSDDGPIEADYEVVDDKEGK